MAGSSATEMAIAVAVAGGLGSLPSAQITPTQLAEALIKFRKATSAPVNVNFFCHTPAGNDPLVDRQWRKRLETYYPAWYRPWGAGGFRQSGPIRWRTLLGSRSLRPEVVSMITVWVCQQSVSSEIPAIVLADTGSLKDSSATPKGGWATERYGC